MSIYTTPRCSRHHLALPHPHSRHHALAATHQQVATVLVHCRHLMDGGRLFSCAFVTWRLNGLPRKNPGAPRRESIGYLVGLLTNHTGHFMQGHKKRCANNSTPLIICESAITRSSPSEPSAEPARRGHPGKWKLQRSQSSETHPSWPRGEQQPCVQHALPCASRPRRYGCARG